MGPGNLPLALRRNAPESLRLVLQDSVGPIDLTGYSVKLQLRLYPGAPGDALLTLASPLVSGIDMSAAATGAVELNWPMFASAIAALPTTAELGDPSKPTIDTFAYDLLVTDTEGQQQVILEGPVNLSFGVTR